MRKIITPCLIVSIIAFSPALQCNLTYRADGDTETPFHGNANTTNSASSNEDQTSPEYDPPQEDSPPPVTPQEDASNLPATEATTLEDTPDETEQEGTSVGQAANEGYSAAKRKQWRNIALAVGAVAVAVTALILVASNDGHHSDH